MEANNDNYASQQMPVSLICPLWSETAKETFESSRDEVSGPSSFEEEALGNRELMSSHHKCPLSFMHRGIK